MKYRTILFGAVAFWAWVACTPNTDIASEQSDLGVQKGGEFGTTPYDSGAAPEVDASFAECSPSTKVLVFLYTRDGGIALFNTANRTFKSPGTARCPLPGVTGIGVEGNDTVGMADGTGQLWEQQSSGVQCTATSWRFTPPLRPAWVTLPWKSASILCSLTGDGHLVCVDPRWPNAWGSGSFAGGSAASLVGLTATWDATLYGVANSAPSKAELDTFTTTGDLQSKVEIDLNACDSALGVAAVGASIYIFSPTTIYEFSPAKGRIVDTIAIPQEVVAPGLVAVASSPCATLPL